MDHVFGVFIKIYEVAKDAGIYIFIGFIFAGFVKAFIKTDSIVKNLGANKISSVIKASLLGIPLPLCSCSVIPVAYSLKKKGASNGAVTSFLISTPETGIDSITLSYALLDPILTIFRPLAAFITSIFAGFFQNVFDKNNNTINDNHNPTCCTKADCKDNTNLESSVENKNWWVKCWYKNMEGVKYAFTDLLPSIANTLAYGILLTGLLSYFIPIGYFSNFQYPIISMLIILIFSIPLYTCATSSTPIAASLLVMGVNPGAVLVFLLAGPATNMMTISAVLKTLGRKGLIIYLVSIALIAILSGILLDYIYKWFSVNPMTEVGKYKESITGWIKDAFGILLCVYLTYTMIINTFVWSKQHFKRKSHKTN